MAYDVALVLGHELNLDGSLSEQTRERTELGERLFYEEGIKNLIMSGGHGDLGECYGISLARQMKNHAVSTGIDGKKIFEEDVSFESVGQLLFSKIGLIDQRKWKNVLIVSHDYHIPRIRRIAQIVFDDGYNIGFAEVKSGIKLDQVTMKRERMSEQAIIRTFENVPLGDNHRLLERLLEKHQAYIQICREIRIRLDSLIEQNLFKD